MKKTNKPLTPKQKQLVVRKRYLANFRRYLSLNSTAGGLGDILEFNAFELRTYVENLWMPGMDWENYGSHWCVDHIVGLKYFDCFSLKDMKLCWSHINLMPAFMGDNHAKGYAPEISEKMLHKLPESATRTMLLDKIKPLISEFRLYYERG